MASLLKLSRLIVVLGLGCLGLSALFLAIGHNPESFVYNYQAEITSNFAYGLLLLGFILQLLSLLLTANEDE